MPLPEPARATLSPNRAAVEAALVLAPSRGGPLTLDSRATAWALAAGTALFLIFLSARALFERQEGLRTVCRGLAWVGLVLAGGAFLQRTLSPALIYGVWRPAGLASNILPWGPFINRNDFAAWLLMAIPLTIGYLLMRIASRHGDRRRPRRRQPHRRPAVDSPARVGVCDDRRHPRVALALGRAQPRDRARRRS